MQQNEREQQERKELPEGVEGAAQEEEQPIEVEWEEVEPVAPLAEMEEQLRMERQKAEEYLDLLRRTQADFVNYRRRVNQEQSEARITGQIALFNQLLPVFDDFGRALEVTPPDLAKHPWVQGLFLIARRFNALLDGVGVKQIGALGEQFDPRRHEAITLEERADVPEGTVLQVARPGYALGDRVIRPAQVIVAGAPSPVGGASSPL